MWTWELQAEMDGTQHLTLQISPKTQPTELASLILSLNRLVLSMLLVEMEVLPDGASPIDSDLSESSSILHNRLTDLGTEWDSQSWN